MLMNPPTAAVFDYIVLQLMNDIEVPESVLREVYWTLSTPPYDVAKLSLKIVFVAVMEIWLSINITPPVFAEFE